MRVAELPEAWNAMYREYLGVEVPNDRQGVLQDSHWSGGCLRLLPQLCPGQRLWGADAGAHGAGDRAYGTRWSAGTCAPLPPGWEKNSHRYGKLLTPAQALESVCGAPFDPECYVNYLTRKYTALYNL